ncbi:RedB [Roseiconus lacunae]|uniref:RedB n=1 Tax=Roseiconus lacunae TaxID=2605694 RepID=UPI003090FC3F|nr:RedB [Stieleria sp. HD01]
MSFDCFIRFVALPGLLLSYAAGFFMLTDYSTRPAIASPIHPSGAIRSVLEEFHSDPDTVSILLFYHPQCPCTVAAIRSLQRAVPLLKSPVSVYAFAFYPLSEAESWIESDGTDLLRQIEGAKVVADPDGETAKLIGITTSGHCLVFEDERGIVFSGGINPLRSHEGDCPSLAQLIHCVNDASEPYTSWPIFGCTLANSQRLQ